MLWPRPTPRRLLSKPAAGAFLALLLASCGDGGSSPATDALVPVILSISPQEAPPPGEAGLFVELEVRTQAGAAYPSALVSWEPTHGGVLAPALTDEEGRLQALWVFNLATDPSGTRVELRACARREPADACGYGETELAEVP